MCNLEWKLWKQVKLKKNNLLGLMNPDLAVQFKANHSPVFFVHAAVRS